MPAAATRIKGGGGGKIFALRRRASGVWLESASAASARLANWAIAIPKPLAITRVGAERVSGSKCTMQRQPERLRGIRQSVDALRRSLSESNSRASTLVTKQQQKHIALVDLSMIPTIWEILH